MPKGEANQLSKEEIQQIQQMASEGMPTGKIMELRKTAAGADGPRLPEAGSKSEKLPEMA